MPLTAGGNPDSPCETDAMGGASPALPARPLSGVVALPRPTQALQDWQLQALFGSLQAFQERETVLADHLRIPSRAAVSLGAETPDRGYSARTTPAGWMACNQAAPPCHRVNAAGVSARVRAGSAHDGGEDVGGVGALLPRALSRPKRLARSKQLVEEEVFGLPASRRPGIHSGPRSRTQGPSARDSADTSSRSRAYGSAACDPPGFFSPETA